MALHEVLLVRRGKRTCNNHGARRQLELDLDLASVDPRFPSLPLIVVNLVVDLVVDLVVHVVVGLVVYVVVDLVVYVVVHLVAQEVAQYSGRL